MQTFELLIVMAALMAMISVVAIAIDWVGKPLRGRRFIARVYRFEDEMVTISPETPLPSAPGPLQRAYPTAPPLGAAVQPTTAVATTNSDHRPPPTVATRAAVPAQPPVGSPDSASLWQDLVSEPASNPQSSHIAGRGTGEDPAATEWIPGMALDQFVAGRRPSPSVKAERYWRSIAAAEHETHFDTADRARMASGKPPRRRNPRTQKFESLQLAGLREASDESAVRMHWQDDSVDPWDSK